jgi:hypothetical protein
MPPLSDPSPVGPSLENLPHTDQNWMEEDRAMVFVEEEFPLVPPQAPPDSLLFSASDLQAPPHNSARQTQDVVPASTMENFPVEEEIPPALHDDRIQAEAQPDIEPQPCCSFSARGAQLMSLLRRAPATHLRHEKRHRRPTSPSDYPLSSHGCSI